MVGWFGRAGGLAGVCRLTFLAAPHVRRGTLWVVVVAVWGLGQPEGAAILVCRRATLHIVLCTEGEMYNGAGVVER